ncbi:hypothetical protein [Thioflexithrix psekupsensis]|uniref:Uncharacterized protein n=1 Tax=Thioflexithrix psekupsensis TaxID=1570016 RepID=A0A251XA47_9GAMM|nr:hypothetical protein [Thioflexithrix psekupsensis]OUD14597.1 hypothetical protein TPSD3_09955 [Thioflexithrix psekupsensis]
MLVKKIFLLSAFIFLFISQKIVWAQLEQQIHFATPTPYENNSQLSRVLHIDGAEELTVKISGETEECCDYLRIFDSAGRRVKEFRGNFEEQLTVSGSSIRVFFFSDGRTVGKGATVSIEQRGLPNIFQEIKDDLLNAIRVVMEHGTQPALTDVQTRLFELKKLHTETTASSAHRIEPQTLTMRTLSQLKLIALAYQNMASYRLSLLQKHQEQWEKLQNLQANTQRQVDKLEQNRQRHLSLLDQSQSQLETDVEAVEKQKLQFAIDGYRNIARSIEAQIRIWKNFHNHQIEIEKQLKHHSNQINILLYLIEMNGKVYEQVANTASLRQSSMIELNQMINVSELQKMMTAIEHSEQQLQQWITRIEQTNFQ